MCGITGVFSARPSGAVAASMTDAIRHRGPDDAGIAPLATANGVTAGAFGHRRLAILDLSRDGHQPMFSPGNRTCLTYNGEIYNFAELRRDLESEGMRFKSVCDTEVVLLGWQRQGIAFLERLRGMFAMSLFDVEQDRGYLIRDRFGIKPLYYAERDGEVLFSSEIRSLLSSGRIPRELCHEAVQSYLATGSVAEPLTIIEGVRAVPPGCVLEVARDGDRYRVVGQSRFATAYPPASAADNDPRTLVPRLRATLRDSVQHHLVADVPVAVFLSGGIDSSAVAGLASEVSAKPIESFTVVFDELEFSEAALARDAAKRFGTEHHEIHLSGSDLLNALPDVFSAMDQPSLDGLNTFIVSRAVRSFGLKVVMSGLGGDELFGGYPSFNRARYLAPFWKLPETLRDVGAAGLNPFTDARLSRIRDMLKSETAPHAAYEASRTLFSGSQIDRLMTSKSGSSVAMPEAAEMSLRGLTEMQQVSFYELTGYMRNTLLRDSDVFSMAHALELRVPLIDQKVTEIAREAAAIEQPRPSSNKAILVDAVRDLLSPETIRGPKRGFTLPFEAWMRSELSTEVNSVLDSGRAERLGLRSSEVKLVWDAFRGRKGGVNWSRPWALYTLLRWAEQNDIAYVPESAGADNRSPLSLAG
ncbi:MAG: asparagine synthase (glutamine-hydrolyzing) [Gemmatimonadales bacterium]